MSARALSSVAWVTRATTRTARGEGAAELAIAADEGGQRAAPDRSKLQRIMDWKAQSSASGSDSQAWRSGRSIQAAGGGAVRQGGDPPVVAPLDPLDPVQVGAVEQDVAVDRPRVAPERCSVGSAIASLRRRWEAGRRAPPRRGRG